MVFVWKNLSELEISSASNTILTKKVWLGQNWQHCGQCGHCPKAARAHGVFGQRSQHRVGFLACPVQDQEWDSCGFLQTQDILLLPYFLIVSSSVTGAFTSIQAALGLCKCVSLSPDASHSQGFVWIMWKWPSGMRKKRKKRFLGFFVCVFVFVFVFSSSET